MKNFLRIARLILPYWPFALLNVFFNILSSVFSLFSFMMVIPFLRILFNQQYMVSEPMPFAFSSESIQHNLNYILGKIISQFGPSGALIGVCVFTVIVTLLKNVMLFMANYYMTSVRANVVRDIRNKLYKKILDLPLSFFSETRKGDIISKMTQDVQEIEISIMSSLEMVFRDPITIVLYLITLFVMNYKLTLFVIVLLPLSGLLIGRIGKNLRSSSRKGQRRMGLMLSAIEETLGGLRIIKGFNAEEMMLKKFHFINHLYNKLQKHLMRRRYLASPLSEVLGAIVLVTVMGFGGSLVLKGNAGFSSEMFIAYLVIFSQIINPAKSFSQAYFNIEKGIASAERIDSILDAEVTIKDPEKPVPEPVTLRSAIEFRNVSFRYDKEFVLKDISLKIEKGKTIAIVGRSGSGKSTLVDLLPRFIDPTSGEVLIDGIPVQQYRLKDLRNLMGIVSQEAILFNDTFFNNIAFGMPEATLDDVIAAAKVANAHDFIMDSPQGYFTSLGDRGGKLSGGERQRISIARAVLKNPPILILDEATSSLDTESERLVQDAIENLMQNRTSIVIAHRLSTIKHADEIIVMDEGRIVERGRHEELLKIKNGLYRNLHQLQML